jgi:prophage antirepressor-like protein
MRELESNPVKRIVLFQRKEVRRVIHNNEWWFVITDARTRDMQGFPQNKQAAHTGGKVAGNARRELEKKSGRKVVTNENYLALTQSVKKARRVK